MSLSADVQKLDPGTLVTLFVLDATMLLDANGVPGPLLRFHAGINEKLEPVIWQGEVYAPWPIEAEGFEFNGTAQPPRPKLRASNITGELFPLIYAYQDLVGAQVIRKRTFLRYLDVDNFTDGINPTADPTAAFPDDIYEVDQKTREVSGQLIEWDLCAGTDLAGVMLPLRQVIPNVCPWKFRGAECGYTGTDYFKADDTLAGSAGEDVCGKRVPSCEKRFGVNNPLPYGGFPGAGKFTG